ncbi:MAG: aminotransferase class I/II-fold pyridoxal phosphate-dependent enzyme [Chloroflexi bacterium]|nr:aminotransferase class I/II-fold pyridoxal phosphate-dependent enzyme [Chloroflexota bacterium]
MPRLGRVALGAQRSLDPVLRAILDTSQPDLISFGAGMPAAELFPVDLFSEATERVLRQHTAAAFGIGPTEGQPALRRAVAERLTVRSEQVLVVAGAQQGLDLIARCLVDPGDAVISCSTPARPSRTRPGARSPWRRPCGRGSWPARSPGGRRLVAGLHWSDDASACTPAQPCANGRAFPTLSP